MVEVHMMKNLKPEVPHHQGLMRTDLDPVLLK